MYSTVDIHNLALARLGGAQVEYLSSPDDDGTVARLCRTLYPHCVQRTLEAMPWSFAVKAALLAQKPDDGVQNPARYPYRYALPVDCLYPVSLDGEGAEHRPPPHILEGGDLLTGESPATLRYVAKQSDPTRWPAAFVDAVAWLLAAELATPLVNDARKQQAYHAKYEAAVLEARALDLRAQQLAAEPDTWIEARG